MTSARSSPVRPLGPYAAVLGAGPFRWFWGGFALSAMGDAMTGVALTWYVFERTRSAEMLALFSFTYTAPVLAGGLVAGWLLDRFDRRTVLVADSVLRGLLVGSIPVAHALGALTLPHVFVVAAAHGALKMIPLAGGPSVVPSIVPSERLDTANALETLGWTASGLLGPALAGVLVATAGAPWVLAIDALTFAAFALGALALPRLAPPAADRRRSGYGDAVRVLATEPAIVATTLMFMAFNVGTGLLTVWLPILADVLGGGPAGYGALVATFAAGEVAGALAAGGIAVRAPLGTLIGASQALAGAALVPLALLGTAAAAAAGAFGLGLFSAPLTIWAQTLRMRVIPDALRGRSFALLRTLMQGALPIGAAAAAGVLALGGLGGAVAATAALVGLPGLAGLVREDVRSAGRPPGGREG